MNIDINEMLFEMLSAIKGEVKENWDIVKPIANQFLQRRKERLKLLIELRATQELSEQKFLSRLKDEKLILEAELHAIAVISKATAQKAANKAIDALESAVTTAIKTIL